MEEIFAKLSEIEAAAQGVLDEAETMKQQLALEMEQQQKEFDNHLECDTNRRISEIRQNLENEKDSQVNALRQKTTASLRNLESYYNENHDRLSDELFQKILNS